VVLIAIVAAFPAIRHVLTQDVAGEADVTASSSELGHDPAAIIDGTDDSPGNDWHATAGEGEWIRLEWGSAHSLSHIIFAASDDEHRIASGALSFSDGSSLFVTFDPATAVQDVPFIERSATWVEFTVISLAAGATAAGIGELSAFAPDGTGTFVEPATTLADTTATSGGEGTGSWSELTWPQAGEIASVQLTGVAATANVTSGALVFGDGSTLPVGAINPDPAYPTTLAFMPRVATSVRFVVSTADGSGPVGVVRVGVFPTGVTPPRPTVSTAVETLPEDVFPEGCADSSPAAAPNEITVLCPTPNTKVAESADVMLRSEGLKRIEAQLIPNLATATLPPVVELTPDASGLTKATIDLSALPEGPLAIRLQGYADAAQGSLPTEGALVYLQLYRESTRVSVATPAPTSPEAEGMTLTYDEEFTGAISASPTGDGAEYASSKPTFEGVDEFGDAIFADPERGLNNLAVVGGDLLRIAVGPKPANLVDPKGWGREHIGGFLSSARVGGSGFSTQYGYFEARMLMPAGKGTWPAFWMLPTSSTVSEQSTIAEIDAVEMYGHDPTGNCQATHSYVDGVETKNIQCGDKFINDVAGLAWHVYGVKVAPGGMTFYIDGKQVASAAQIPGGGDPMFFLTNLALGGGWPIDLSQVGDSAALYVDYIRVYN